MQKVFFSVSVLVFVDFIIFKIKIKVFMCNIHVCLSCKSSVFNIIRKENIFTGLLDISSTCYNINIFWN